MADHEPVATGTYPGICIEYFERPHRHYLVNGEKVPSVTTVLGILDKPALPHWAAKVTAEGAWKLIRRKGYELPDKPWKFAADLKKHGLDHRSATNEAAARGVDVHQVWEDWNTRQLIPDASKYPENRRGYIRGMAAFIMEHQPRCHEAEQVVGSAVHGFAGRLDTVVVLDTDDGLAMVDVKTARGVYPNTHFPQLAGYEVARRECGLAPTVRQGILRLGSDGTFELAWSDAEAEDFLCLLAAYKRQEKWSRKGKR